MGGTVARATDKASGWSFGIRIAGSVVAMNAGNGSVLWRHHIGRDWTGEPKRLSSNGETDFLVYIQEQGLLKRLASADGSVVWETKIAGRIFDPLIDGDEIFVATNEGDVCCIDAVTGQSRWIKRYPQRIGVGVGGAPSKEKRYVLGEHSNLYVSSRASGQCDEVVHVAHNASTIVVPPIRILNHLLLFRYHGTDFCTKTELSTTLTSHEMHAQQTPQ